MSLASLVAYNSSSDDESDDGSSEKALPAKIIRSVSGKNNKVKILAPKKVEYKSEDEDEVGERGEPPLKKINLSSTSDNSSSGLFAKLPAPNSSFGGKKTTDSKFVPYVLTKRPNPQPSDVALKKRAALKRHMKPTLTTDKSDDEDDNVSFFSFLDKDDASKQAEEPNPSQPAASALSQDHYQYSTGFGANQYNNQPAYNPTENGYAGPSLPANSFGYDRGNDYSNNTYAPASNYGYGYPEVNNEKNTANSSDNNWIEAEQMIRLSGKKNKKEKIEIIDVKADDALEGNKELLLKSITKEQSMHRESHSNKGSNMPTSRQKSKHQLSYLIHQAKANEIKLQEQWASGKAKRDAARMRYGF